MFRKFHKYSNKFFENLFSKIEGNFISNSQKYTKSNKYKAIPCAQSIFLIARNFFSTPYVHTLCIQEKT